MRDNEEPRPLIKDEYGYVLNPYVPKYISKRPWYIKEKEGTKPCMDLGKVETKHKDERSFDEVHDRWNNFDINDYIPKSETEAKERIHGEESRKKKFTGEIIEKEKLSNLRIREDLVKYLDKGVSHVSYNPKSRSIISQDISCKSEDQMFSWDEKKN